MGIDRVNVRAEVAGTRAHGRRAGHALVGSLLVALAIHVEAASLPPTPAQTEGPFYPRTLPPDRDADLVTIIGRGRQAQGTVLYFDGRVLATDARPVAGARVELWQPTASAAITMRVTKGSRATTTSRGTASRRRTPPDASRSGRSGRGLTAGGRRICISRSRPPDTRS